ncbi:MAG TPA: translation initiation factor IF-2 [Candidatus Sulfotelmatobacter sp.]|jgi:translation initiation factor IF-2|nr:translation initiation factor IF-2 [Candidatus Sulfotelmatobacter sp.]
MPDKNTTARQNTEQGNYPPVVAVLGHVDHGKTTLLDAIRKSSIAEREKGGITQKIGASSVEIVHEEKNRWITFIDTPGHEAFTKMRSRGAQAADLSLLVVSAVDGVKPQTHESVQALRVAKAPFIVVLTKADLPTKNSEKVKQELLKEQIQFESYGGDTPVIEVSAKTNFNIKELLDLILLLFDTHKKPTYAQDFNSDNPLEAVVIESKLDVRSGAKATVIIKNGTIKVREDVQIDGQMFKVRTLFNTNGKPVQSATVGDAVEILGFTSVPAVGSLIKNKTAETVAIQEEKKPLTREMDYRREEVHKGIAVILIADTQGSLEAIIHALPEGIKLIHQRTGEVNEADVLTAKATGSIVLSFNTKIKPDVVSLAYTEKVLVRNYEIIYELLDEIKDALDGKLQSQMEQIFGSAKILAKFPFEKTFAYGIAILDGRIARGDRLRILRDDVVIGETTITSLRVGKNATSKVEKGHEAGLVLNGGLDIQVGDVILSHS